MSTDLRKGWGVDASKKKIDRDAVEADERRRERVRLANVDPQFFCEYYLAHYFKSPLAPWQHEVIEDSEDQDANESLAYAVPRGHGKTTFIGFALSLRDLLRGKSNFTVYIGPTKASAADRIEEIKVELENNERILEDYGDMLAGGGRKSANDLQLANGARIVARGAGQSMRGVKSREHRPDRVVIDDIDKDEEALKPERVDKRVKWFNRAIRGLRGAGRMQIICIGNVIARKTFLTHCLNHPRFVSRVYRAIQQGGTPLMPHLFTLEILEGIREDQGSDAFNTEYMNDPPGEGTRPFREEWLRARWTRELLALADPGITVSLDLSAAKNERSDFQALVAVQRGPAGEIFLRKADLGRRSRKELVARVITFCEALGLERIRAVVVESNGFQEWFKEELDENSAAAGADLPIVPVTHTLDKYSRVAKLSPIAEGGRLLFPPEDEWDESVKTLHQQFVMFPDDRHDDGPDAAAMAVEETARQVRGSGARGIPISPFDRI